MKLTVEGVALVPLLPYCHLSPASVGHHGVIDITITTKQTTVNNDMQARVYISDEGKSLDR